MFANTLVFNSLGLPGASGANSIISQSDGFNPDSSRPIQIFFAAAQSSVSITVVDIGADGLTIDAFDITNTLVASTTAFGTDVGVGQFQVLTVAASGISQINMYQVVQTNGDGVLFDDLIKHYQVPKVDRKSLSTQIITATQLSQRLPPTTTKTATVLSPN